MYKITNLDIVTLLTLSSIIIVYWQSDNINHFDNKHLIVFIMTYIYIIALLFLLKNDNITKENFYTNHDLRDHDLDCKFRPHKLWTDPPKYPHKFSGCEDCARWLKKCRRGCSELDDFVQKDCDRNCDQTYAGCCFVERSYEK